MFKSVFLIGFILTIFPYTIFSQSCITINQQPQNILTVDNDDLILTVDTTSSESLTYQWQIFDTDISDWVNVNEIADDFNYSGDTTETLTISNVMQSINGALFRVQISGVTCSETTSDEALITYATINVNNLFTPNDDGFNDLFIINGLSRFPNSELKIYNRWGNLIHQKINYQNDWDGVATTGFSINGSKKVPSGTYFYTIDLKFDSKKLSGWLYINR